MAHDLGGDHAPSDAQHEEDRTDADHRHCPFRPRRTRLTGSPFASASAFTLAFALALAFTFT